MADPNRAEFYQRVDRIIADSQKGAGFEAVGTLGRSYYTRPQRKRVPMGRVIVLVLATFLGLKAVIHAQAGEATYDQRVEGLRQNNAAGQLVAYAMQADAITVFLSDHIRQLMR